MTTANPFAGTAPVAAPATAPATAPVTQPVQQAPVQQAPVTQPVQQAPVQQAPVTQPVDQFASANNGETPTAPAGDPFADPVGPGTGEKVADFVGALLLVKPAEWIEQMPTSSGPSDAIRGDMVLLDGDRQGELLPEMLFFQRALRRDLKKVLDGPTPYLLGRLGKGTAAQGKSAPYIFIKPTDEEKGLARQFLAARGNF